MCLAAWPDSEIFVRCARRCLDGKYFLPGPCLRSSRPDRLSLHRCSERFRQFRTPAQEDKVCKKVMKQSTEVCDKIMSILAEDAPTLMRWGATKALGVNTGGRVGLVVFVDAFKHRGPVAIYPAEHPRYYDVEVQDYDRHVLKSVACIAAGSLVENIDRLVEVAERYVEDIDRWLIRTPSEIKPYQQLARIMKTSPEVAKKVRMKAVMLKG